MGLLVKGKWRDEGYGTEKTGGRFERWDSTFRNWVTADGGAGPTGEGGFKAEPGRYHLYTAAVCPWAHRTVIVRKLKGLEDAISLSVVATRMGAKGWIFGDGKDGEPDPLRGAEYLHEIYTAAEPGFSGRVTVPVLWDRERETIVNNESSEIIRMLGREFDDHGRAGIDLYPEPLRAEIDEINEIIYDTVNNGVYKCGFATTQEAYEDAFDALFATLDELESRLGRQRYLVGDRLTEADWRLFPTLARFDTAYYGLFKCNLRRLTDYPNLWAYARELYQHPGVAETIDLRAIRYGYSGIAAINPNCIEPMGPDVDFTAPHDRDGLEAA